MTFYSRRAVTDTSRRVLDRKNMEIHLIVSLCIIWAERYRSEINHGTILYIFNVVNVCAWHTGGTWHVLITCTHKHTFHPLRHSIHIGGSHPHILKQLLKELQQKVRVAQTYSTPKTPVLRQTLFCDGGNFSAHALTLVGQI